MAHYKKKEEHEEMSEAWLLPYSDLMTLLLAVFIVLFAVSKVDVTKAESIAQAFKGILQGGDSIFVQNTGKYNPIDGGDVQQIPVDDNDVPEDTGAPDEEMTTTAAASEMTDEELLAQEELNQELLMKEQIKREQMEALKDAVNTYIDEQGLQENFNIVESPEMLTLTLSGDVLFDSGSAKLNATKIVIAKHLAEMIQNVQDEGLAFQILVSGHTDNVPISKGSQFASNWHLSLERAASFMSAMIEGSRLDPRNVTAVGHGELDPVDTNDTAEGRAKNRRVEIQVTYDEKALSALDGLAKSSK
jgi:chemotaxis protein MotB